MSDIKGNAPLLIEIENEVPLGYVLSVIRFPFAINNLPFEIRPPISIRFFRRRH